MPDFQTYRAVHKIHLGGTEPPSQIDQDEIVQFDGSVVKRASGQEVKVQYPTAIQGAIKAGWLVSTSSTEQGFRPRPAGVEVRTAQSTGEKRARIDTMTVSGEERDLGSIGDIRPSNAPKTHVAKDSQKLHVSTTKGAPTGARVSRTEEDSADGVVVSRLKTPTKFGNEIGKGDLEEKSRLDNSSSPLKIERVARATGDVQEAIEGEDLQDLLPDAATSGRPPTGLFRDQGVKVGNAGSTVGGQEEGEVVSKVGAPPKNRKLPPDSEAGLRTWVESGSSWDDQPVTLADVRVLLRTYFRKLDASIPKQSPPAKEEVAVAAPEKKPSSSPIVWDLTAHWKTREKNVESYKGNPTALSEILKIENSPAVKKAAQALLA